MVVILQPKIIDNNTIKEILVNSLVKNQLNSLVKTFIDGWNTSTWLINWQLNYVLDCLGQHTKQKKIYNTIPS